MILAVKTADFIAELVLFDDSEAARDVWHTDRDMARGLLERIEAFLAHNSLSWEDISGIIAYKGPGSFTSLRIGLTTVNAMAYSLHIPIVGVSSDDWLSQGVSRLQSNENDMMVLPEYGAEPRITNPRK